MGYKLGLVCLILAQILVVRAMAEESEGSELKTFQNKNRKLGVVVRVTAHDQPVSSSAESSDQGEEEDSKVAEAPVIGRLEKQHESEKKHHSDHKSVDVAGGGVIIGGFVTAIFAAVFCYIRVTRRRDDVH